MSRQNAVDHIMRARRRGIDVIQIGNRLCQRIEDFCVVEDFFGTRGGIRHALLMPFTERPGITRVDNTQLRQATIQHCTRAHADIFDKLWGYENNDRS